MDSAFPDWLTKMVSAAGNGSSPFGSLGGMPLSQITGGGTSPASPPGQPLGAPPPPGQGGGIPGIWGKLFGQQPQQVPGAAGTPPQQPQGQQVQQGGATAGQNFAANEAMNLLKGPQFGPTQWMPWMGR